MTFIRAFQVIAAPYGRRKRRRYWIARLSLRCLAWSFAGLLSAVAQNVPAAAVDMVPRFEVASVKMVDSQPHSAEDRVKGIGLFSMSTDPGNRFFAHNASLLMLTTIAYDVDMQYIEGDPNWSESQFYDVDATVEGGRQLSLEEMKPLLRSLLAERFHLSVHRVTRPVSGFALVVAKGGAKVRPLADATPGIHAQMFPSGLRAEHIKLDQLASILSRPAGQPVVDKTGLSGLYDITLSYAPRNDPSSALADFFTAVEEQLGLKLVPAKVPVEYLVIDHVERVPTEN